MCFNADNTHLIKVTSSEIFVTDLDEEENNTRSLKVDWDISSVACSPRETQ